jgi:outer membrane protein assembly factor BamB
MPSAKKHARFSRNNVTKDYSIHLIKLNRHKKPHWLVALMSRLRICCLLILVFLVFFELRQISFVNSVTEDVDNWIMLNHDATHSGISKSSAPGGDLLWLYNAGFNNSINDNPVIASGRVYVGSRLGKVYCLDAESGQLIWSTQLSDSLSAPAVMYDRLYIGSMNGKVYCLDTKNGNLLWSYQTGSLIESAVTIERAVYVTSRDHNLYCLDPYDGHLLWRYTTRNALRSSPAVSGGYVYFGSFDNNLYCLDALTGRNIWNYDLGSDIDASPTAFGGLYIGAADGKLYSFTGNRIKWSFQTNGTIHESTPAVSGPIAASTSIYVGSTDGKIYCIDAESGSLLWKKQVGTRALFTSPAIVGNRVYINSCKSGRNWIVCLDRFTGTEIWSRKLLSTSFSSPAIADGRLYVGDEDGNIYCFGTGPRLKIINEHVLIPIDKTHDRGANISLNIFPNIIYNGNTTKYVFLGWTSNSTGGYTGTNRAATVVMSNNITETSNWKTQHYLAVSSPVKAHIKGGGWYDDGSTATFEVKETMVNETTGTRYVFNGWISDKQFGYFGKEKIAKVNVSAGITQTAQWKTQYMLNLISETPMKGSGWYEKGETILLVAESPQGFLIRKVFRGWGGDVSGITSNMLSVSMDGPKNVTAYWTTDYSQLMIATSVTLLVIMVGSLYLHYRSRARDREIYKILAGSLQK